MGGFFHISPSMKSGGNLTCNLTGVQRSRILQACSHQSVKGNTLEFQNISRNSLGQRRIADIWLALRMTAMAFVQITAAGIALTVVLSWLLTGTVDPLVVLLGISLVWLLSSWFILRVWLTYHEGIVIDAERSELSFPATDVENRLIDIITLKRFFDHGRRETLRLASIETVMNETRARREHYAVNVAGNFKSRQFSFDSKQKRDEFRAAINWGAKQTGVSIRQDGNSDVGGYGG